MAETNRSIVERYARAWPEDFETLGQLRHPDFVEDWPQTGERIPGHEAYVRIHENYPGGLPEVETKRIVGSEDRLVLSPNLTPVRIHGTGETYTIEGVNRYPNGDVVYAVAVIDLRDGKVWRQRTYFGPEYRAPEWRAQWVERY